MWITEHVTVENKKYRIYVAATYVRVCVHHNGHQRKLGKIILYKYYSVRAHVWVNIKAAANQVQFGEVKKCKRNNYKK